MKILMVGSEQPHALESFYFQHFKQSVEVDIYPASDIFLEYYTKSVFNKVLFRLGLSSIYSQINRNLISLVNSADYNVVMVFKGMEIFPETLQHLRRKAKLVNYNPDHPFYFHGRGSGNKNVTNGFAHFDHHLSYSHPILNQIEERFPEMSKSWLPFGFSYSSDKVVNESEEILRGVFVGTADKDRALFITYFLQNKIPIDVYGNGWSKFLNTSPLLEIHPPVFAEDFITTVQHYRFNLNLLRPHNHGSHNMRTFELPALSCLVLAEFAPEQGGFFKTDKEVVYYKNPTQAIEKANHLLNMSFDQASTIRRNAYRRSIQSEYSYEFRAKDALKILKDIIK